MTNPLRSERTAETLKRIATALRCTVEDLVGSKDDGNPFLETQELLTLWDAIFSDEGRQRVLKTAREVVRAQKASST